MKQPKITVLITVKNSVNTIKQCIESILNQTYKNYDIIVVDAFSYDGTYENLKTFGKKIKLYQIKGWAPKAYNWVIKRINSEFVAFTDADCVVDKNWLKKLLSGFESKEILAVAGYCGTPKNAKGLQRIIGIELEDRFKHFPKFILRAPTMNLCVRTNILKKLRFDERFKVAFETDFGYRLNEFGKILYNKNAIVYHYHRATWKSFFKQQYTYAEYLPSLYFKKHIKKITGDFISKFSMALQIFFVYLTVLGLIFNLLNSSFIFFWEISIISILIIWFFDIFKLTRKINEIFWFIALFFIRLIGWSIGIFIGILSL
jgi:glycosyltransferase involved in cell wall biosynthesis